MFYPLGIAWILIITIYVTRCIPAYWYGWIPFITLLRIGCIAAISIALVPNLHYSELGVLQPSALHWYQTYIIQNWVYCSHQHCIGTKLALFRTGCIAAISIALVPNLHYSELGVLQPSALHWYQTYII
jgi:uncharacterized membrane protein YjgN (DUF898 family)